MQHLLAGAVWDHDGIRDDVRAMVVEHLADPAGVLDDCFRIGSRVSSGDK
jgi:hypothetical protein